MKARTAGSPESDPISRNVGCIRVEGMESSTGFREVAEEVPVPVTVNGRQILVALTSPGMLREYIVGFLFTEGIVKGPEEIESIRIEAHRVSVLTKNPFRTIGGKRTILSGCGGASSFLDPEKLPRITAPLQVAPPMICNAVKEILSTDFRNTTKGVYAAGIFSGNTRVIGAEDIGWNNALDRVIGYGLLQGIDFSKMYAVSSGLISSDTVRKCAMAGIPLFASSGATTTLAIRIAEKTGITLAGFVREDRMDVYTHADRIIGGYASSRSI